MPSPSKNVKETNEFSFALIVKDSLNLFRENIEIFNEDNNKVINILIDKN